MLNHYESAGNDFRLGLRPGLGRRAVSEMWRGVTALLNAAADLDATVYGTRLRARRQQPKPTR